MGVQLNNGREVVVRCPTSAAGWSGSVPCEPAIFVVAAAGVAVVRLRSIGPYPLFRTYNIQNVTFAYAA